MVVWLTTSTLPQFPQDFGLFHPSIIPPAHSKEKESSGGKGVFFFIVHTTRCQKGKTGPKVSLTPHCWPGLCYGLPHKSPPRKKVGCGAGVGSVHDHLRPAKRWDFYRAEWLSVGRCLSKWLHSPTVLGIRTYKKKRHQAGEFQLYRSHTRRLPFSIK